MANSNTPFRLTGSNSWEELLSKVNDKLENPPTGCNPIETILTPDVMHRWSKSDIQEVHDRLNQMPGDCFSFESIPDLWKTSIITDIENQLDNSWCECDSVCDPLAGQGDIFLLDVTTPIILRPNCVLADINIPRTPLVEFIPDVNVGISGITGRGWKLRQFVRGGPGFITGVYDNRNSFRDNNSITVFSGEISCNGDVIFSNSETDGVTVVEFGEFNIIGIPICDQITFPCDDPVQPEGAVESCQNAAASSFPGIHWEYEIQVIELSELICENCTP